MSERGCTLCGLPTPDPPIMDEQTDGEFCCSGCLQVYQLLQDMDEQQARQIREETIRRRHKEWEGKEDRKVPQSSEEAFLKMDGMHCATCESFIESMSRRQAGIYKSEASYATELVKVFYDPNKLTKDQLPEIMSKMGYRAHSMESDPKDENLNTTARLMIGGFFSIVGLLIYILFLYPTYINGHGFIPLKPAELHYFIANIFVMTSLVLFYTGFPILRGAWVSCSVMKPNMDLLISIAALSAYLYSTGAMLTGSTEVYFDVTMAIVMVVSLGNYYESRIKSEKNSLLTQLMDKRIKQARVQRNGRIFSVALNELLPGDRVIVKAGERIPVDGKIVEGKGVINEALITGESLPISKKPGDQVISGTILTKNALTIEVGSSVESTIDRMIRLMWDIQSSHSGKQRLADKISAYFVPIVLFLGVATFLYQLIAGYSASSSMLSGLAVLIVSCPCALGLATPLAVAAGLRDALKNNIIFKTGSIFEERGDADILAFDKTGTITTGRMQLLDEGSNERALKYAQALEQYSSHPLAEAIAANISDSGHSVEDFRSFSTGVSGNIDGRKIMVGQPEWLQDHGYAISEEQQKKMETARKNGHVPTGVAWNGSLQSILVIGDNIREEADSFIRSLKQNNKKIAIITGDTEEASRPIKEKLQPDYLFPEARPESKTEIIKRLKKLGTVTMIGDGSNDALALAEADLGIAFGDLTAIAAESSQIVIPGDRLERIMDAFRVIKQTKSRIRQNLGWAFLYNITTIPLAIAGLINPLFAALAMAGSSLMVVANSSRRIRLGD